MPAGLFIRLRPTGPWRIGPDSGDRDRVERVYHSDTLYSAVSGAMARLGMLEEWLDATARATVSAVRFSSCFPFNGETLYVMPPRNLWPPLASSKVRWKGVRFAPLALIRDMLGGKPVTEEGWAVDGASETLITMGTQGPFRVSVRSSAAVDRGGVSVEPHSSACLEFAPNAGLWMTAAFADDQAREKWKGGVTAALRLLADSGFGGERSRGWGRADIEFSDQEALAAALPAASDAGGETAWWMLSLYHPASDDPIDWKRGNYAVTTRSGRAESGAGWGETLNNAKRLTRMITEGSVLVAPSEPRGSVTNVAPDGFPHPVYRAGYALAIRIPLRPPVVRETSKEPAKEGLMKYRVMCLTPTLVGDGQKLSPIDYMVWRDHVNVLDQRRIFKLLAKGPRLDGYLAQLKKADRLDFASWGGFAQNFAGRRIPFENPGTVPVWERAHAENLFIPTFAASLSGPYLPATAVKGALRTGAVFDRWTEGTLKDLAERIAGERPPRNPASKIEDVPRAKRVSMGDSRDAAYSAMKVYLLRVSTLVARGAGKFELGWKSVRGSTDSRRIEESTPLFAEMATPGTTFEGAWSEKSMQDRTRLFQSANRYAAGQLARHKHYAESAGLARVAALVEALEERLKEIGASQNYCMLSVGWGGGLHSKVACLETEGAAYRSVLKQYSLYDRALQTGLPFPKTRRVIFENNQPASLPGWVLLEVA